MASQASQIDISQLSTRELYVLQDKVARRLHYLRDLHYYGTDLSAPPAPADAGGSGSTETANPFGLRPKSSSIRGTSADHTFPTGTAQQCSTSATCEAEIPRVVKKNYSSLGCNPVQQEWRNAGSCAQEPAHAAEDVQQSSTSVTGEEQTPKNVPNAYESPERDPVQQERQNAGDCTQDPAQAAAEHPNANMADTVAGFHAVNDPWSHSPVPPVRFERPWYQGRVIPFHVVVPQRDLRVATGNPAAPVFGGANTSESQHAMELATVPDTRICSTKCMSCPALCGKRMCDHWNTYMHLCSECDLDLFQKHGRH